MTAGRDRMQKVELAATNACDDTKAGRAGCHRRCACQIEPATKGRTRRPGLAVASKTTSTGLLSCLHDGRLYVVPPSLPLPPRPPSPRGRQEPAVAVVRPTRRDARAAALPFASLEIRDSQTRQRHLGARTNDPERLRSGTSRSRTGRWGRRPPRTSPGFAWSTETTTVAPTPNAQAMVLPLTIRRPLR
jgi:hypothetical protein